MKNKENNIELTEILVNVSRNTKVNKGGRKFSFSAIVIVGNKNGKVGYGLGKASEVIEARSKATTEARKCMKQIHLKEGRTIHHDVMGEYGSGKVLLRSAPKGKGVIAGGAIRSIFNALGVSDIVAKSLGSRNPHNVIKATFNGLLKITSPKKIAQKRGKSITEIIQEDKT